MNGVGVQGHAPAAPRQGPEQAQAAVRRQEAHGLRLHFGHGAGRDDHIRTLSPGLAVDPLAHIILSGIDRDVAAELPGPAQAVFERIDDDQPCSTGNPREHEVHEADRPGAENRYRIAQIDPRDPDPVHDAGEWFEQGGLAIGNLRGKRYDIALSYETAGDFDEERMGAVAIDAEGCVLGAVVGLAADAGVAVSAAGIRNHADPLPDRIPGHIGTHLLYRADEFVAQHDALAVRQLAVSIADDLQIRAADRGRTDTQQQAVAADPGDRDLANGEGTPLLVRGGEHRAVCAHTAVAPSSSRRTGRRSRIERFPAFTTSTAAFPSIPPARGRRSSRMQRTKSSSSAR